MILFWAVRNFDAIFFLCWFALILKDFDWVVLCN